jgi:hypothetical protein
VILKRIFTENLIIGRIEYKFAEHQLGEGCSFRSASFASVYLGVIRKKKIIVNGKRKWSLRGAERRGNP